MDDKLSAKSFEDFINELLDEVEIQEEFENSIQFKDVNLWDNRLKIDPIHGIKIESISDLDGFMMLLEDGNPFEYTDFRDIYS